MPSISASVTGLLDAHADALAREVVSDLIKNPRTPRRAAGPGVHDRGVLRSGGLLSPARIRELANQDHLQRLLGHQSAAAVMSGTSAFVQLASGLNVFMARPRARVFGPRSFWYTTPSWLTMKVITPETPYCAGKATSAKPAIM